MSTSFLTAAATGMDSAKQTKILKTIEKGTKRRWTRYTNMPHGLIMTYGTIWPRWRVWMQGLHPSTQRWMKVCVWWGIRRWNRLPNRGNAGIPYPVGDMGGVFLPLIFWCLKTGENGGFGMLYLVGFNTDVKTPLHPHPIPSIPHRHFLPDFPYEKPDRHHLHDPCRSSWKCGGVRFEYFRPET